jgi:hypothetical protein
MDGFNQLFLIMDKKISAGCGNFCANTANATRVTGIMKT